MRNPNKIPTPSPLREPGDLSPQAQKDLQETLAAKGLLFIDDVEPVILDNSHDGPDRRANTMDAEEVRGIEERRTPPLPDAPAVEAAFREVMRIAKERLGTPEEK